MRFGEIGFGLGELSGQGARLLTEAGAFEFDGLKFYEIFDEGLHLCKEGYGIWVCT